MTLASTPVDTVTPFYAPAEQALRRRIVALLIDTVVIAVVAAGINSIFGVTQPTFSGTIALVSGGLAITQTVTDWPWLALAWIGYYATLEGLFGATVGKAIVGLRVTDLYGRRTGWKSATTRNIGRIIDVLPVLYLIGGIQALVTREHQRLGDRWAKALVVPVEAVPSSPLSKFAVRQRVTLLAALLAILVAYSGWFAYFGRPPLVIKGAVNTHSAMFNQGVNTYHLGSPAWGKGTVTYPIAYQTQQTLQSCSGHITLDWTGFPTGWEMGSSEVSCSPRIYP
jgi:uncharacterized RDD family membrane protein YckC